MTTRHAEDGSIFGVTTEWTAVWTVARGSYSSLSATTPLYTNRAVVSAPPARRSAWGGRAARGACGSFAPMRHDHALFGALAVWGLAACGVSAEAGTGPANTETLHPGGSPLPGEVACT